jgi:hypothetical protein
MKPFIYLSLFLLTAQVALAQNFIDDGNCPPPVWCLDDTPPNTDRDLWGGMVGAADASGADMNEHAASADCDDSWSPSCLFASLFPCGYGSGTPQATLCDDDDIGGGDAENPGGQPAENDPPADVPSEDVPDDVPDNGEANENVETQVFELGSEGITAEKIYTHFAKVKNGNIVHKYKNGFSLVLVGKYRNEKRGKYDMLLKFKIQDNKRRMLAQPLVKIGKLGKKKGYTMITTDLAVVKKKLKKRK